MDRKPFCQRPARFVDTNGDNVVDQWSYYKDGVEVCRDEDVKFTGKAEDDAAERRRTEVWAG